MINLKQAWQCLASNFKSRRMIAPALALAMAFSLVAYESIKPPAARAAATEPTSTPLDDNSVSALLSLDHAMETLAARVTPAIVNVTVTSKTKAEVSEGEAPDDMQHFFQFFGPGVPGMPQGRNFQFRQQPQIEHGLGSGVIISPDGYIVTNNHVVDGAVDVRVTMSDRRILSAKVVGTDPLTDLAVIKVDGHNLPNVPWGDSNALHPGQTVLAFGNPFGFRFTVTRGIVSALNRPNPFSNDARKPGGFIQTDAAINQGNSGGPLVDARGEVVGINTFLISPTGGFAGMGFAIPTQIVKPTVETLIRDGKVEHARIGVGIADVTPENSKFFQVSSNMGAVITQVEPDAPGAKAGLKVGDVITQLDGKQVSDAGQLQVEIGLKRPGTKVELTLLRDGKEMKTPVTLEALDKGDHDLSAGKRGPQGKARWGLGLSDVTADVRDQLQAPRDLHGAVVDRVVPGSPADNAGLQRGDVITQVDRKDVESASDVQKALSSVPSGQDALVLVWSNGGSTFRVLHATEDNNGA
jgi:serine protease Do